MDGIKRFLWVRNELQSSLVIQSIKMRALPIACVLSVELILSAFGNGVPDLTDDYKKEGLIPDVLDTAPKNVLWVSYNDKRFEFASELTPTEVKDSPHIGWGLDSTSYYTLVMNDPDAPSREDPKMREILHWLVVNIPGDDFSKGETLVEYIGSGAPRGTGLHRYVLTVYHQPSKLTFDEQRVSNLSLEGRDHFNLRKFIEKYKLDEHVAGTMFKAQYDDYVPLFYKKLGM